MLRCLPRRDNVLLCEPEDRNLVVDRVRRLTQRGIVTFVVGFGSAVDVLQRAALAAGLSVPIATPRQALM